MLIEAAKGGHTNVVHLLLDYPHSIMMQPPHSQPNQQQPTVQEVPENARVASVEENGQNKLPIHCVSKPHNPQKSLSLLRKIKLPSTSEPGLTSAEAQQVC